MSEKKKVVRHPEKSNVAVIYLGPPIPGVVSAGTVYSNGLTPQLWNAMGEMPALKALLVDITKTPHARKELKNKESAISVCYKKVAEYAATKGVRG